MISLCEDREKILKAARREPVFGSLIETLYLSYGSFRGLADFYITDNGGVICRQGQELLVAGNLVSAAEVVSFGRMLGIRTISAMAGALDRPIPEDVRILWRQAMVYPYESCQPPHHPSMRADNLSRVYDIIKEGSAPGFDHVEPAVFITDTARRRNLGLCEVFVCEDAATAGYYGLGKSHGIIACVATLSDSRGRGYGSSAVLAATDACIKAGRMPALIAESEMNMGFYRRLGYVSLGRAMSLTI